MPRRLGPYLWIVTVVVGGLVGRAHARGGGAVADNLLAKGHAALQKAEAAWLDKDKQHAVYFGKTAERIFEDVLAQVPRHRQALLFGTQAAALAGDVAGAQRWFERFVAAAPLRDADPEAHFLVAFIAFIAEDRPDRAIRSLQRMYGLDPSLRATERDNLWFLALSDLGRRYLEADKGMDAARHFATAARIARRLGNAIKERAMLANLGAAYLREKRFIEATEVYEGLIKLDPMNALWHYRLGSTLANQSKFPEAVVTYKEVMQLLDAGYRPPGMQEVGEVRMRMGNCLRYIAAREVDPHKRATLIEESRGYLAAYVQDHPDDARGHKWMGALLYDVLEQPYEALGFYRRANELDPICDDALRSMIQILSRHPAPPGKDEGVWKAQLEAMRKDMETNAEYRKQQQRLRERKDGSNGCL